MSSSEHDRIRAILRATNNFDLLKLPRPHADLMDQPIWPVSVEQVNRAFRKISLCCHPDKSSHPDAPRAFELLKKAKACLGEPMERDDYLINFLKQQKTHWEGSWSSTQDVGEAKQRTSAMREEAQRAQGDSVVDAMRERRERAEAAVRKKQRLQAASQRRADATRAVDARSDASDDDDDDGEKGRRQASDSLRGGGSNGARHAGGAARKRPKFM